MSDITRLELGRRFDLVVAPYLVMQNLATDQEVAGLFAGIRGHLADGSRGILSAFRPFAGPEVLAEKRAVPGGGC